MQFVYGDDGLDPLAMDLGGIPVNFSRLYESVRAKHAAFFGEVCLTPAQLKSEIDLLPSLSSSAVYSSAFLSKLLAFCEQIFKDLTGLLGSLGLLHSAHSAENSSRSGKSFVAQHTLRNTKIITARQLKIFFDECNRIYCSSRIEPGTAVGAIAGQSIGEPGTQMTLKSLDWSERIVIASQTPTKHGHNTIYSAPEIGSWIDQLMQCEPSPATLLSAKDLESALSTPLPEDTSLLFAPAAEIHAVAGISSFFSAFSATSVSLGAPHTPHVLKLESNFGACDWSAFNGTGARIALQFDAHCGGFQIESSDFQRSNAVMECFASISSLEQVLLGVDVKLGWLVSFSCAHVYQSVAVVVAFGSHVQRQWELALFLGAKSSVRLLECGVAFYTAEVIGAASRCIVVITCSHPSDSSERELAVALLAATRVASDTGGIECLNLWAAQADTARLRALAQQQQRSAVYHNASVVRLCDEGELGDTHVLDVTDRNFFVPSVSDRGVISLKRVTAVTKHLPVNEDGSSNLVRIITRSGRSVVATKAKSFLTRVADRLVPTRGDALVPGMHLPVARALPAQDICANSCTGAFFESVSSLVPQHDSMCLDSVSGFFFGTFLAEGYTMGSRVILCGHAILTETSKLNSFIDRLGEGPFLKSEINHYYFFILVL